jgi:hypothetical protein
MNVKDFVEATLIQIVEGINAASAKIKDSGVIISPLHIRGAHSALVIDYETDSMVNLIEFDIAITVNETDKAQGGAGISIAGIHLGGKVESANINQTVSRVKFMIPMKLKSDQ